jgi:serine/threonine protein kinase
MSQVNRCPECGAEPPSGALEGLCPKCLLAAGLESRDEGESAGNGSEAPTTPHVGRFVPPEPAALAAHFRQLEILELLGHGGMGAVYKARQPRLDRLVALKIIRPESADTPAFAERFNREAKTLARLSHPQIVAVYDFGEVNIPDAAAGDPQRAVYFFVMEYVDGPNLRQLMHTGELTPQQALAIVPQICEALQFAHNEGVVHRDIKPENILLDKRGRVKIADFGLAKLAGLSAKELTLTETHQVMGTPRYMAPEQMEGTHLVDHRADIYSLGVVFYEMLTGEVPMGHFEPPSKKVEIDVRLDEVVLRTLAREPERRYQHVSDVKSAVDSITSTMSARLQSTPANMVWPYWRPTWQQYAAISIVIALMIQALASAIEGETFFLSGTVALANCLTIVATSFLAFWIERFWFNPQNSWRHPRNLISLTLGLVMMLLPAMILSPIELRDWLPAGMAVVTAGDERWLRIFGLAMFLWTVYFVCAYVLFALGQSIRSGGHRDGAIAVVSSAADEAQIDVARQMVQFPAIGLIVIGALSLALGTLVALMSTWASRHNADDGSQLLLALPAILIFTALPTAMIVGGVKMLRLTDYRWAVGASVLAVSPIPAGPLWLLSLPLGIWSLVVLARPEVKRGFALRKQRAARDRQQPDPRGAREPEWRYQHASEVKTDVESISRTPPPAQTFEPRHATATENAEIETARQQVQFPVIGLLVSAILMLALAAKEQLSGYTLTHFDDDLLGRSLFLLLYYVPPVAIIVGALRMLRLSSYWRAVAAGVLVIISPVLGPVGDRQLAYLFWGLRLVVGIWSLVVLAKPEAKQGFARRREMKRSRSIRAG